MPSRRQRRAARKKPTYYLLPLGISIAIVLIVTLLFNMYVHMQQQQEQALRSQPIAQISVDSDNVSVIFNNERTSVFKGYRIDWNNGEGLETGANSRLFIPLSTKDHMRLESNSTIFARRDEGLSVVLGFQKGNMWLRSEEKKPASEATAVRLNTMRFVLSEEATVAISDDETEEVVAVVHGTLPVTLTDATGGTIRTVQVGVGQQIRLSAAADATSNLVEAIPAQTTSSEWFTWNAAQDLQLASYEGEQKNENTNEVQVQAANPQVVTFSNLAANATFREAVIGLEGGYDPKEVSEIRINGVVAVLDEAKKTWKIAKLPLVSGRNTLKATYKTLDGSDVVHSERVVTVDESAPETPKLLSPTSTSVTSANVQLRGSVGNETARVKINNYELQKYKPGETEWLYYLNAGDNMSPGSNVYTVIAIDSVGNESEPLKVEITYTPSAAAPAATSTNTNAATTRSATTNTQTTPAASSTAPRTTTVPTATTPPQTPAESSSGDDILQPAAIRSTGSGSGL